MLYALFAIDQQNLIKELGYGIGIFTGHMIFVYM